MFSILKQSSWLVLAQLITRIIGFFYTLFLARSLGVADFGLYSVALAYYSILSLISDFGFTRYLTREVAKGSSGTSLLLDISVLRFISSLVIYLLVASFLYFVDPDRMRVYLVLIATLALLPQSLGQILDATLVALQKMRYSAASALILSLITALTGFYLILQGYGPVGATVALLLGNLMYLLVLSIFAKRFIHFGDFKIRLDEIKKIVFGSLPYGILIVIGLVSFKVDFLILSYLRGNFEVGIYSAAFRFLEASVFIPNAFAIALFPTLAKLHVNSTDQLKSIYFKSLKLMFLIGLLVLLSYIFILPYLIRYILPDYLPSINAIFILSLAIPFIYIHIPSNQVLLSSEKYLSKLLKIYLLLFSTNIVMYFILISKFGFIGAAWGTVISEVLTFLAFYLFLQLRVFR